MPRSTSHAYIVPDRHRLRDWGVVYPHRHTHETARQPTGPARGATTMVPTRHRRSHTTIHEPHAERRGAASPHARLRSIRRERHAQCPVAGETISPYARRGVTTPRSIRRQRRRAPNRPSKSARRGSHHIAHVPLRTPFGPATRTYMPPVALWCSRGYTIHSFPPGGPRTRPPACNSTPGDGHCWLRATHGPLRSCARTRSTQLFYAVPIPHRTIAGGIGPRHCTLSRGLAARAAATRPGEPTVRLPAPSSTPISVSARMHARAAALRVLESGGLTRRATAAAAACSPASPRSRAARAARR